LNIANPWDDQRLRNWNGYSRKFFFDQDNRPVSANNPDARSVEMIPLAIYGLDHPKIPALLIDFRSSLNPKKREMSRRFVDDLAKNILSLSSFGNLPYFAGRHVYDFVTGRRGVDLNQPTRLRSYSELKLLLSFNSSIDTELRTEIERRVQNVSLNPLNNDDEAEVALARQQYDALMNYARRPDGRGDGPRGVKAHPIDRQEGLDDEHHGDRERSGPWPDEHGSEPQRRPPRARRTTRTRFRLGIVDRGDREFERAVGHGRWTSADGHRRRSPCRRPHSAAD
jgi:hypothetical protein